MSSYFKASCGIINSSLWNEDAAVCKLWITILAMKDGDHVVRSSISGIANNARLPVEFVRDTITNKFEAPDPDSTTPDFDGRRMQRIEGGGWLIINGPKYQELGWSDEKKEYERRRKAEYRSRKIAPAPEIKSPPAAPVTQRPDTSDAPNHNPNGGGNKKSPVRMVPRSHPSEPSEKELSLEGEPPPKPNVYELAEIVFKEYPKKVAKPYALKTIVKAIQKFGFEHILEKTKMFAKVRSQCDQQLTPFPGTWYNQERFNDDPETWKSTGQPAKPNPVQRVDRSVGTTNEGTSHLFAGLGKVAQSGNL